MDDNFPFIRNILVPIDNVSILDILLIRNNRKQIKSNGVSMIKKSIKQNILNYK